jgi:chromosome segregation protein
MRIKRLELCGFKSFLEPTVLEFSPGISGIVGPNGCGKSNLVDAIRWVLGEQTPSRLRGQVMEDVLFNGAASRGPVGMAEVSLLLENDSASPAVELPEWLRDVPEILVTRRYFRSGESEYLINRRPCRLRDVTELFLGTGVGTRAYAMIEQGKVDQLVNARPEDLRLFIEEAAGTTRYRSRRLAAERKIERTRENLARVNDVLHEIDRSIGFYRRMAKRAEQYRQWQAEMKRVELQLARRQYERSVAELEGLRESREALARREAELHAAIETVERERAQAKPELESLEARVGSLQEELSALRAERGRLEARLEMVERERRDVAERLGRIAAERTALARRAEELRAEGQRQAKAAEAFAAEFRGREEELSTLLHSTSDDEEEAARVAAALEEAKTEIVELFAREAELRNRLGEGERRDEELRRRRERLEAERAAAEGELEAAGRQAEELAETRVRLEADAAATEAEAARFQEEAAGLREERQSRERAAVAAAEALAEVRSRLASAEEIERGYERYPEGVRAVMRRHAEAPNGVLNLVAEVLEAPAELERAVAAVLGERLQSVIVRTAEDARSAIEELKRSGSGRSTFLPIEAFAEAPPPDPGADEGVRLLDLVRVEEGYAGLAGRLLGDAIVVDDLASGLSLYRQNGRARTIVTREGDVFHSDGTISGGSEAPYEERLLAQRREIRRLREELTRLEAEHEEACRARERVEAALDDVEARAASLEERRRALTVERVRLEKDLERLRETRERCRGEIERCGRELSALDGESARLREEVGAVREELDRVGRRRIAREEERRVLEGRLSERRRRIEDLARTATELRVDLARVREREERAREAASRAVREAGEVERRLAALDEERGILVQRAAAREQEVRRLREEFDRSGSAAAEREEALEVARRRAEGLRAAIERCERELSQRRVELDGLREERGRLDLAHAERTVRLEGLVSGIAERYQANLAEVELGPEDEAVLEARLAELSSKVDRIDRSQVGVEAAAELAEAEGRREFLASQKADLEASIAALQKTIANLNRASRDRFAETFAAVNERFQEIVPKLFRGGRGRLILTDESNLLETGVDIQVQPPGMNLRTLSLLSGGQKALTAVSLIFALFLCRPSPFCVLDEVDAPLDDANIDRFNELVREMGRQSQFLLITHNKRTMEVADTLYGVTMEEPGISKIVSVRLQRAA